jgi:hypothetical protein
MRTTNLRFPAFTVEIRKTPGKTRIFAEIFAEESGNIYRRQDVPLQQLCFKCTRKSLAGKGSCCAMGFVIVM